MIRRRESKRDRNAPSEAPSVPRVVKSNHHHHHSYNESSDNDSSTYHYGQLRTFESVFEGGRAEQQVEMIEVSLRIKGRKALPKFIGEEQTLLELMMGIAAVSVIRF